MTTGEKILVGIVIVATIITGIIIGISKKGLNDKSNQQKSEMDSMVDYIDDVHQNKNEENIINNEVIEDNTIENEITNENVNNDENTNTNQNNPIVGKEEQESNTGNVEIDNEKTAIELAQKEWGISIESYIFEAKIKNQDEYEVSVRNATDRNIVTIYNVNIRTGAVTE